VYIKQVALIVIMAQIGCLVPARHATVPLRDRLLSRIGSSDDLEHNMSTFATEMKEVAYVLNNITDNSLVIVDELGRGTSNIDGVSIAFAIAEALLNTPAFTLFVTHYPQITALPDLYPNAKNVHLRTSIDLAPGSSSDPAAADGGIVYLHQIGAGPCDMRAGYGLIMAEQCGYPADVLADAREIRRAVRDAYPILTAHQAPATTDNAHLKMMGDLLRQLQLLKDSTLDDAGLRQYLHNLRSRVSEEDAQAMLRCLEQAEREAAAERGVAAE
jgi:DNA mismatch repair ATPase MutS